MRHGRMTRQRGRPSIIDYVVARVGACVFLRKLNRVGDVRVIAFVLRIRVVVNNGQIDL